MPPYNAAVSIPWIEDRDIDPIAVERACLGEKVQLNAAEKRYAIEHLMASGWSISRSAERIGISNDTARRLLQSTS